MKTLAAKIAIMFLVIQGTQTCVHSALFFVNGGLELQPGDPTLVTVLPGSSYAGWTSAGAGDVEFCHSSILGPASQGQGVVDLNGIAYQGAISQAVTTDVGALYTLRFAMSGNPGVSGIPRLGDKTMDVFWGGINLGSFVFHHVGSDTQQNLRWEYHEVVVVGTGSDLLKFASTTSAYNDAGPVIDDITITAVPEPSTIALVGFAGLAFILKSRHKS
jgi:hypothetical protein